MVHAGGPLLNKLAAPIESCSGCFDDATACLPKAVAPAEADGFIVGAIGVGGDGGGFIILAARAAITQATVFLLREAWATGTRRREEQGEQEPYKHPAARRSAAWSCGSLDGGGGCHCSGCKTACEWGQILPDATRAGSSSTEATALGLRQVRFGGSERIHGMSSATGRVGVCQRGPSDAQSAGRDPARLHHPQANAGRARLQRVAPP